MLPINILSNERMDIATPTIYVNQLQLRIEIIFLLYILHQQRQASRHHDLVINI